MATGRQEPEGPKDGGPTLPLGAQELYRRLANEVAELNRRWNMYRDLFLGSPVRLALLKRSADVFFGTLQRMLLDDVILGITRLSDPARSSGNETQSLQRLVEEFADASQKPLRDELEGRLERMKNACKPFRTHRNKRVAHRDLTSHAFLLPDLSPADFDGAIKGLNAVLNTIEDFFTDLTFTGYRDVIEPFLASTDGLVLTLQKAAALDLEVDPMEQWKTIKRTDYADA